MNCCNSCAYLTCNKDKPNPITISDDDANWYAQENLDRLWNLARKEYNFLTCHSTDPRYFGKDEKKLVACVGFTSMIFMHLMIFKKFGQYGKYRDAVGRKMALDKRVMLDYAFAIATGSADLLGTMKLPTEMSESRPMRYPTGFEKTLKLFSDIQESQTETA